MQSGALAENKTSNHVSWVAFFFMLAICIPYLHAHAQLRIDINQGHSSPMPIAITAAKAASAESEQLGQDIMQVVAANLERSGLFRPIDENAFIQQISNAHAIPRFADWRQINAMALMTAHVEVQDATNFAISFRLWDVYREKQIAGKEFNTFRSNWRRVSHLISDEIYKRLTGEEGYFDSRIVYIAESGPQKRRVKRLAIMDQDGENHKFLTNGGDLVLTPRFSPDSQEILYMSYAGRAPRVYVRDLQTGREDMVGSFKGMSFAPRFANDGERVVMSIADGGNTDLYEMNLRTKRKRQLTRNPAIETSPSYSPDGKRIVFESDRAGGQQLYVMNADGNNVERISYGEGRYASPVWSPRGDWIAFTKMKDGMFFIGIMRPDGSGERVVDSAYLVEGATWSPNGRVLLYTRQNRRGAPNLYTIDITGKNRRRLVTPVDASDPAWSPLLPL